MRPTLVLYALCAGALLCGVAVGCAKNAAADSPQFGQFVGQTDEGVIVRRFEDDNSLCYVATHGPYNSAPVAISCR